MKLRLRNFETKETLKLHTPEPCTLHHLKLIVSERASLSSSSLYLSLNRKDELSGSNPETDTLGSFGVTSGDLIFFSDKLNSFKSQNLIPQFSRNSNNMSSGSSSNVSREPGLMNEQETLIVRSKSIKSESDRKEEKTLFFVSESINEQEAIIVEPESRERLILEPNSENDFCGKYVSCRNKTLESDTQMEETLVVEPESRETLILEPDSRNNFCGKNESTNRTLASDTQMEKNLASGNNTENQTVARNPELGREETLGFFSEQGGDETIIEETMGMEINGVNDVIDAGRGKGFSVPGFLRKVFKKEIGDSGGCDHKLVVIAVHAVLKESGFVGCDTVSKTKTYAYTLPEIDQSSGVVQTVTVKVQMLGKYVKMYGSLAGKGSDIYSLCLNEERLAIVLNLMWANLDTAIEESGSVIHPEKEVFEFWKTVKDELALPLLIDLCDAANLPPPSCFTRLPTDLKFGILELLPGVDLAKAACVSQELRLLSSYDDLWKVKFLEQFGNAEVAEGSVVESSWKRKFVKVWEARKRRIADVAQGPSVWIPSNFRDPAVFRFPRIIGGDYDVGPNIPMGGRFFGRRSRRDFIPPCNFDDPHA